MDLSPSRPSKGEDKLLKSNTQLTWRAETDVGKLGKRIFLQGNLLKMDPFPEKNGAFAGWDNRKHPLKGELAMVAWATCQLSSRFCPETSRN